MKFFSLILIHLILVASAFAQQDYPTFGKVTVTPNTVAIVMKQLAPCPLPDGSPSSDFPASAPAADIAGISIQNDLDQPVRVQYMTVETDHDVLDVSTENDMHAMFATNVIPAHGSITSICGLHVGNIDVGASTGAVTIPARLDVLAEGKNTHGLATLFEEKAKINLQWDGRD